MAIADKLTEIATRINAEIAKANTKTGEADTTLTDAVQTLIDGYGGGGGLPGGIAEMVSGTCSVPADTNGTMTITFDKAFTQTPTHFLLYAQDMPEYLSASTILIYKTPELEALTSSSYYQLMGHLNGTPRSPGFGARTNSYGLRTLTVNGATVNPYSTSYYWRKDYTYRYLAWRYES